MLKLSKTGAFLGSHLPASVRELRCFGLSSVLPSLSANAVRSIYILHISLTTSPDVRAWFEDTHERWGWGSISCSWPLTLITIKSTTKYSWTSSPLEMLPLWYNMTSGSELWSSGPIRGDTRSIDPRYAASKRYFRFQDNKQKAHVRSNLWKKKSPMSDRRGDTYNNFELLWFVKSSETTMARFTIPERRSMRLAQDRAKKRTVHERKTYSKECENMKLQAREAYRVGFNVILSYIDARCRMSYLEHFQDIPFYECQHPIKHLLATIERGLSES